VLDSGAAEHRRKWGCEWNRDITQLVAQADLRVHSMRRWHFGTTYIIEAEPA
jgi:methyltransferase OMS1